MINFAILAATILVGLLGFVFYFFSTSKSPRSSKIPGPPIADKIEGNLPELREAGTFHDFLSNLHDEYGPIVGFYLKDQYIVSIGSPELFQENSQLFDRAGVIFEPMIPLTTASTIQLANGVEGKRRHAQYSKYFSSTGKFYPELTEIVNGTIKDLQKVPNVSWQIAFGSVYSKMDMQRFIELYDSWILQMEGGMTGGSRGNSPIGNEKNVMTEMQNIIKRGLELRRARGDNDQEERYIDILLNDPNLSEEAKFADAITMLIGGLHTTANLLTFTIYFLADHPEIQEKLHDHLDERLTTADITQSEIDSCEFLQQVINESLRLGGVGTFATRFSEVPYVLGGYTIPAGTPVMHALVYVLHSEKYFPDADCFNPDNFSKENSRRRHPFAFKPFGFAGNRTCVGNKFAMTEGLLAIAMLVRNFKFDLVPGQVVTPIFGLATRPTEEIWVTVEKRK